MREGRDVTIIAMGLMVERALKAADALAGEGLSVRVLNMHTLKPLDEDSIVKAAKETGAILTVEEHVRQGGLGSRVAQVVAENQPVPMSFITIEDCFSSSGQPEELLAKHGLTAENIVKEAKALVKRKR
jgi:transketolase